MKLRIGFLSVLLISSLLIASCGGSGTREWGGVFNFFAGVPTVEYSDTGEIGLGVNEDVGGWYGGDDGIGVVDGDDDGAGNFVSGSGSGASVIMPKDTYVSSGGGAPTWVNLGVGSIDVDATQVGVGGMTAVGAVQVFVQTSLSTFTGSTSFSKNLTVVMPLAGGLAGGTSVWLYQWNDGLQSWGAMNSVSQIGALDFVDSGGGWVTFFVNKGGQFAAFVAEHSSGTGGTQ